ncbi:MAG TPA: DUF2069 domain-containing protein [Gammaproteobacteria bacterium]|nr:DUF2069 domain-containing protein [Gammaproteobacteria bacterium]
MIAPRKLTLAATGALAVWLLLWFAWLSPPAGLPAAVATLVAILPLLIVAWPLIRDRAAAYAWCGFIALGYMAHGLTEIFAGAADQRLAIVELVLVGVLFVASGAALRSRRAQTANRI